MSCLCLYIGFFKVDADERCFSSSFSLSLPLCLSSSCTLFPPHPTQPPISNHPLPPTTYHLPFFLETLSPPLFVSGSCTYSAIEVNITIIARICARTMDIGHAQEIMRRVGTSVFSTHTEPTGFHETVPKHNQQPNIRMGSDLVVVVVAFLSICIF